MSISRRTILKGAAAIGAATAVPAMAANTKPNCTVIDSRIPASLRFAKNAAGPVIDIAHEDATFWRNLRAAPAGAVTGITRWSDFVMIRGVLEEQGKRLRDETHDPSSELFRWTMSG
jgi:TAT (twin-arginine translocation) pathway signal sequence